MNSYQQSIAAAAEKLSRIKIIPVLVLNSIDEGLKMGEILSRCGLGAAEITFRTDAAETVIRALSKEYPELLIGAGTILNTADLDRAFNAGAKFAVAPGFNPNTVRAAVDRGLPFAPGVCTPGELEQAHELGCKFLKFFPAEAAGGVKMLQALIAPYKHLGIRFMPTGGVNTANVAEYLAIPQVAAVGGTWLGKSSDLARGDFASVEVAVKAAVELAQKF